MGACQSRSTPEPQTSPAALFAYATTVAALHARREDEAVFVQVDAARALAQARYEAAANDGDDVGLKTLRDILVLDVALTLHQLGKLHAAQATWPCAAVAAVAKDLYAGRYGGVDETDLTAQVKGLRLLFSQVLNLIREADTRARHLPHVTKRQAAAAPTDGKPPPVPLTDGELFIGVMAARHATHFFPHKAGTPATPFAVPDYIQRALRDGRFPTTESERLEAIRFVRNSVVALLQALLALERSSILGTGLETAMQTVLQCLTGGFFNCDPTQPDPEEPEVRYHLVLCEVAASVFLRTYYKAPPSSSSSEAVAANKKDATAGAGGADGLKFRDQFLFDLNNGIAWLTHWKNKYIPPDSNDDGVVHEPHVTALRIVVVGDIGTQGDASQYTTMAAIRNLLAAATAAGDKRPVILVHLGDIYFSGTVEEAKKFEDCYVTTFPDAATRPPMWAVPGNHEYIAAGEGFFDLVSRRFFGGGRQTRSFFTLTFEHLGLQVVGIDTGTHSMKHADETVIEQVRLDALQTAWVQHQLKQRPKYRTIICSHHQIVSAFVKSPTTDQNAVLLDQVLGGGSTGPITAWFNGHEHHFNVFNMDTVHATYPATRRIQYLACSGNGSIPSSIIECTPPTDVGRTFCDTRFLPTEPEDINTAVPPMAKKGSNKPPAPIVKSGFVVVDIDATSIAMTHYYVNSTRDPSVTQKGPVLTYGTAGAE